MEQQHQGQDAADQYLAEPEEHRIDAAIPEKKAFEIVLPGAGKDQVRLVSDRLVKALGNKKLGVDGKTLRLSISVGGAELRGTLRAPDGQVIGEINHRRYNHNLADLTGAESTWTAARRAIRQFAEKVADAYAAAEN